MVIKMRGESWRIENNPEMQVELLKKWNVSEDTIKEWAQVITNG